MIDKESDKKAFLDYVMDFEYQKLGIQHPDAVIFLSAPFEFVIEIRKHRKQNDSVANDIHERDLNYMRKVYDNAQFVARYLD